MMLFPVFVFRKKIAVSACLLVLAVISALAQESYDLPACIETGLQNNYDIRIVRNAEQISTNNFNLENAGYLPSLSLAGGYTAAHNDIEQKRAADGSTLNNSGIHNQNLNAGIDLNWTVFDGFAVQTNYQRLKQLQQMGELQTRIAIENYIAELSAEYFNFLQQKIKLQNLKASLILSKTRLDIVEAHYIIGSKSGLDLQQAKVDFNADSSAVIRQRSVLNGSRTRLNYLMGVQKIENQLNIADTAIVFDAFLDREKLWNKTLTANTQILLAEREKTLGHLNLQTVQSANYPYLRLNVGYDVLQNRYNRGDFASQNQRGLNYGVTMGFDLTKLFDLSKQQKNARIKIENVQLEKEKLLLSLARNFVDMWNTYEDNLTLVRLESENLAVARNTYETAMERFKLGELSGLELREAQVSRLAAEQRFTEAQFNTKLCEISLRQISGETALIL